MGNFISSSDKLLIYCQSIVKCSIPAPTPPPPPTEVDEDRERKSNKSTISSYCNHY